MKHEKYQQGTGVLLSSEELPDPPAPTRALTAIQRLTDDIAAIDGAASPATLAQVITRLNALTQMVRRDKVIERAMLRFLAEQYQQATEEGE